MRKQLQDLSQWHTVFAWWPTVTHDGVKVWLEPVERRLWAMSVWDDHYHYRLPGDIWDDRNRDRDAAEGGDAKQAPARKGQQPGPKASPKSREHRT